MGGELDKALSLKILMSPMYIYKLSKFQFSLLSNILYKFLLFYTSTKKIFIKLCILFN